MLPCTRKRENCRNDNVTKSPLGSEVDEVAVWSSVRRRKRRRRDRKRKLQVGSKVEVRQFEAGLRGSWHTGVVIGYGKSSWVIEYDNLLAEDGSSKLKELVCMCSIPKGQEDSGSPNYYRGHIRPSPPVVHSGGFELSYGFCVDAFFDDAWWEGVIFDRQECLDERLVFFPDQGDQLRINVSLLRITQDWDEASGDWSCRGTWCFLELLEKFVLEGSMPVSIRQIWYDLRTSGCFRHGRLEWICRERSFWSKLVLEAIQENMNAALGLACALKEFVYEELTTEKTEDGRKIRKDIKELEEVCDQQRLIEESCISDNSKQTQVFDHQRLIESVLQDMQVYKHKLIFSSGLDVPAAKHAIDLQSTDDLVLHKKDFLLEGITNASQERGSTRDFQPVRGKDEALQALRTGNNGEYVSQKVANSRGVHNKLISIQKIDVQALSNFLLACNNDDLGQTRSKVLLEAKRLLSATGWVFGTASDDDSHRFYYDSPSGQRFYSFSQACKAWEEEQEAEMAQSIMDGHGDRPAADSISPPPKEDGGNKMRKLKGYWRRWGKESQAKYSPQAMKDYCAIYLEKKRVTRACKDSLILNTKLHLLALGWTIDYKEYAYHVKNRYISPSGKSHSLLIKACMYLMQQDREAGRTKNNAEYLSKFYHERDTVSQGPCEHSWHLEKLKLREEEHFSVLDPLGGSQDSGKEIQEDENFWSSSTDHVIGEEVHHDILDLSQDPIPHVRQTEKKLSGEEYSSVLLPLGGFQDSGKEIQEDEKVWSSATDHVTGKVHHELLDLSQDTILHTRQTEKEKLCEEQSGSVLDSSSSNQHSMNDGRFMAASLSSTEMIGVTDGGLNSDAQHHSLPQIPAEQQSSECNYILLCQENFTVPLTEKNDGRFTDASLSSTKMIGATDGGSNSDFQQDLLPEIPAGQQDSECNYSPLCQENFMAPKTKENDGMFMDASLSSTKMIGVTDGGSNSDFQQYLLPQISVGQQDSEGNCSPLCQENFMVPLTKESDSQGGNQCSKLELMKRKRGKARTILSWLIDNSVVLPKQKVYYKNNEGDHVMAEGRITLEGIKCMCCKKVYGPANFAVHAGGTMDKPAASIFLKNGKSLLQCQTQLVLSRKTKFLKPDQHRRVKGKHNSCRSDNICSVCHYGGELILCDYCPSAFHFSCIDLKGVPEGIWSCASCQCGICGHSEYNSNVDQFTEETIIYCDQCECQYHVGCLRKIGHPNLGSCPDGSWFCSESCSQIFVQLQKLVGKSKPTSVEGLSWRILRSRREDNHDVDLDTTMVEHHSKLWVALGVLHECFQAFIEPRTKKDFFTNVVFNRGSKLKRLNFQGFYTMILEWEEEIISVATVRIFGEKIAELPLIGTRVQYRRSGMCRLLMNEIEKVLRNLGIKRLLLPAVPDMLPTWINSFGFATMTSSSRLKVLKFTLLDFEETSMCEKSLLKDATTRTLESKVAEDKAQEGSSERNEAMDCDRFNSSSEVINPRLPSDDTQDDLMDSEVGIREEARLPGTAIIAQIP